MQDTSHGIMCYGSIVELYSGVSGYWGFIAPSDHPRRKIFFHETQRCALVRSEYLLPLLVPIESNIFSGPTIRQKHPGVGDLTAYYLGYSGKGPFTRRWCLIPPKKTGPVFVPQSAEKAS